MAHTKPGTSRRKTLSALVIGSGAVYGGALVVPAYKFVTSSAASSHHERWIRVARLESIQTKRPTRLQIVGERRDAFTISRATLGSIWLLREKEKIRALSAACPHLGCAVDHDGTQFSCPCHTSTFSTDGKRKDGPSPRGLDELDTRVVDGWIEVHFQRFRQGTNDKTAIL